MDAKRPAQLMNYWRHWLLAQAITATCAAVLNSPEIVLSQVKKPTTPAKPPAKIDSGSLNTVPNRPLLKAGSQGADVVELQGILALLGYYTGSLSGTYEQTTAAAVSQFQKAAGLSVDGIVGAETWNRLLPPSPRLTSATSASSGSASASSPSPTSSVETFPSPFPTKAEPTTPANKPASSAGASTKKPVATGIRDRPSTSQPDTAAFPILRLGMKGPAVAGLQERLRALGYLKSTADGVFGAETQAAVRAAQRKLSLDPDGVVGSATWNGLLR